MRILLDEQLPRQLALYLIGHEARTVQQESWAGLKNGVLLTSAEAAGFAQRACELAENREPLFIGTLAAAYAEAGRFPEAIAAAEKARDLAKAGGLPEVARRNTELLELYRAGKPWREKNLQ